MLSSHTVVSSPLSVDFQSFKRSPQWMKIKICLNVIIRRALTDEVRLTLVITYKVFSSNIAEEKIFFQSTCNQIKK